MTVAQWDLLEVPDGYELVRRSAVE